MGRMWASSPRPCERQYIYHRQLENQDAQEPLQLMDASHYISCMWPHRGHRCLERSARVDFGGLNTKVT
eukprot:170444-Pyramimonas_sp.AAC.1